MIYLDNAATTKVDKEVIEDITWYLENRWYNPSSVYEEGLQVKRDLEEGRRIVAEDIGAEPEEIIFTSGGSEANNLAIKGLLMNGEIDHIITTKLEHSSVAKIVDTCDAIPFTWYELKNDDLGRVDLDCLYDALFHCDPYKTLVVINAVNNETGVMQPLYEISAVCRSYGVKLHVDMVQGFSHIGIDVNAPHMDMMSVSGHKWGCPKGIGFLYKRKGIDLSPIITGGKQENGFRGGTENVAYIYAMARQIQRLDKKEYTISRDDIIDLLGNTGHDFIYNGCIIGSPNILSITVPGVDGQTLMTMLNHDGICVSTGSACNEGSKEPSRVLLSMDISEEDALCTIRVSLSWDNTIEDIKALAKSLKKNINMLKG